MNVEVAQDILDFWDNKTFNPSARHQLKSTIYSKTLEQLIAKTIEKEVFSKFPELVAGDIKVDVTDNIEWDMIEIYVSWRVWMPTGFNKNILTLQKVRSIIKIQLSSEMLEDQPDAFKLHFAGALDVMEDQMDKVKFEFYKKGIEPKIVASYLKKYAGGRMINMPYPRKGVGAIP
jgi:hypothetical protein